MERVAAGEDFDIVRRGKLVARIESVGHGRAAPIPERATQVATQHTRGWVTVDELRSRAGRCFDRVAAGETIWLVRGGKLLARIVSAGEPTGAAVAANAGPIELEQLRKHATHYFDQVAAGKTIEVIRFGRPVAQIVSIAEPSCRTA
jgi:antitoxin (DNA-binding transcriptional repressor) of toxin-antitoxin stability system